MIDLYTHGTTNGQKVSIMLEECALPYKAHIVELTAREHLSEDFLKLNPAGKIPVITDHDGPDGKPFTLSQSMAIVLYLAEKTGKFLPAGLRARAEAYRYLALVASDTGGAFTGIFMFGKAMPMEGPLEFYRAQADRQMKVFDQRLSESPYLAGEEYSVADILAYPVAATSSKLLPHGMQPYPHFKRWADEIALRPAVQRGIVVGSGH